MSFHTLKPRLFLPSEIAELLDPNLPPLGPGFPQTQFEQRLKKTVPETLLGATLVSSEAGVCCLAGMWLWNGFLGQSHELSQSIDTPEGSWWHGIMHRREPDAGNAAYWFRRVGNHPLFSTLGSRVRKHATQIELPDEAQWLSQCTRPAKRHTVIQMKLFVMCFARWQRLNGMPSSSIARVLHAAPIGN
jgi:hypothetical protein